MRRAPPQSVAAGKCKPESTSKGALMSAHAGDPHTQIGTFLEAADRDGEVTDELYDKCLVAVAARRHLIRSNGFLHCVPCSGTQ
jgi:hypothetical protein